MKKKNLSLNDLKVKSFITSLSQNQKQTVIGGATDAPECYSGAQGQICQTGGLCTNGQACQSIAQQCAGSQGNSNCCATQNLTDCTTPA